MTARRTFTEMLVELERISDEALLLPDRLARACVKALHVDGASLSWTLHADRRIPLGASDDDAAAAERLQYTLGDGPCLAAQQQRATVVAPLSQLRERWPLFAEQLVDGTPFRGVIAFPVRGPLVGVAAVDLYSRAPAPPDSSVITEIPDIAELVGLALVSGLVDDVDLVLGLPRALRGPTVAGRHRVWLAIGHVSGQLAVTSSTALALLRATAFGHGVDVETAANLILDGEVPLPTP